MCTASISAQIETFCEALLLFWQNIDSCYEEDTHFLKGWTFNLTFFQLWLSQKDLIIFLWADVEQDNLFYVKKACCCKLCSC